MERKRQPWSFGEGYMIVAGLTGTVVGVILLARGIATTWKDYLGMAILIVGCLSPVVWIIRGHGKPSADWDHPNPDG